jgi:hypothetical protein
MVPHRGVDLAADVLGLGPVQQIVEARIGRQVEDTLGMVGGGLVDSAAAPRRCPARNIPAI